MVPAEEGRYEKVSTDMGDSGEVSGMVSTGGGMTNKVSRVGVGEEDEDVGITKVSTAPPKAKYSTVSGQEGEMVSGGKEVSDDEADRMEDDWEGMMDDEFLQLTDEMIGDHQTSLKAGEYKDELVTPATSLYSHPKTGQVVRTNEMVVPELNSSPPSSPNRGTGGSGLYRPTTMYSHWDSIRDMDKDRVFELWTSPSSPLVTDILDDIRGSSSKEHTDKHTDIMSSVPETGVKDERSGCTGLPSIGMFNTQTTGKPLISNYTNTPITVSHGLSQAPESTVSQVYTPLKDNTSTGVSMGGGVSLTTGQGIKEDDHQHLHTGIPSQARSDIMPGDNLSQLTPNRDVRQHSDIRGGQAVKCQPPIQLRGVKVGTPGGSPLLRRNCRYDDKGFCHLHGQGVEKYHGGHTLVRGANGKLKKKYSRQYYYVCDLDVGGEKKLKQTQLSFTKVISQEDRKSRRGEGRDDDNDCNDIPLLTSKAGQHPSNVQGMSSKRRFGD